MYVLQDALKWLKINENRCAAGNRTATGLRAGFPPIQTQIETVLTVIRLAIKKKNLGKNRANVKFDDGGA